MRIITPALTVTVLLLQSAILAQDKDPPAWKVSLAAGQRAPSTITVQNRCKKTHKFDLTTNTADFLKLSTNEVKVKGGRNKIVPVAFDTTGLKPGLHKGSVIVRCKSCNKEPTCSQDKETLRIELTIPGAERADPYKNFKFKVEFDGAANGGSFSEVSGLGLEENPVEYRDGSEPTRVRKIPGMKKFTNITLKRGIIGDMTFWKWVVDSVNGNPVKKSGSIILLDEKKSEVVRWNFMRGWPCKWTGPGLNAAKNEVALETLEICTER